MKRPTKGRLSEAHPIPTSSNLKETQTSPPGKSSKPRKDQQRARHLSYLTGLLTLFAAAKSKNGKKGKGKSPGKRPKATSEPQRPPPKPSKPTSSSTKGKERERPLSTIQEAEEELFLSFLDS